MLHVPRSVVINEELQTREYSDFIERIIATFPSPSLPQILIA